MKKMKKLLTPLILAILSGYAVSVNAAVIDFENFQAGTIIDDEYAPDVTISTINGSIGPNAGVVFDTSNPTGQDDDLAGPFGTNDANLRDNYDPGNVFIIQENHTCDFISGFCQDPDDEGSGNAGTFFFDFTSVVTLESIDFFDIETTEGTFNDIRLFDENNSELLPGSFFVPDTGGDNMWGQLLFDVEGVKRIELNMGGSGAIDNIRYTSEALPEVPVPAAVWLFSSGLIGLTVLARRRKV